MITKNLSISISKINKYTNEETKLYEYVPDFDKANLLVQLEMKNKLDEELIIIYPGWNVKMTNEDIEEANKLSNEYRVDIIKPIPLLIS